MSPHKLHCFKVIAAVPVERRFCHRASEAFKTFIGQFRIQKVEECNNISSVYELMTALKYQYASMVSEIKSSREGKPNRKENYHIKRCKDYIVTHLRGKQPFITEKYAIIYMTGKIITTGFLFIGMLFF